MPTHIVPSLLDQLVPRCDATRVEHRVIHAPVAVVYDAVLEADFLDAARRHMAVRALFGVRQSLERLVGVLRRRRQAAAVPPPSLRLLDLTNHGEWVLLGESPPREIAFGAVGRFWAGETRWLTIDAAAFRTLNAPGYAKIGCNFLLRPAGDGSTLVTYEARTVTTDERSRSGFARYWRVVSPFVGVVMRAMLAVIARDATREARRLAGASRVPEHIV